MNETTNSTKKKRAGRSPSYPGIGIDTALKRAQELYNNAQHHSSNVGVVAGHWGYKAGSGLVTITIAALKRYGFLLDEGSGKDKTVRLTDLALDIIKDKREGSSERDANIYLAAFKPKINQEMLDKYGLNLPSDQDMMFDLTRKKKFTDNGAKEFIGQYKRTLNFINGIKSDIIPSSNGDSGQQEEEIKPPFVPPAGGSKPPAPPKGENMKNIEIPIPNEAWPTLTATFPMSERAWDNMMKLLNAMKPGLVKSDDEDKP